ncbi:MAG: ribonuclease HII [bacterium]|nr:ribonuclease HII [bacterium]
MLKSYHTKGLVEAGCDEAGRGCLAGPVVAAAVILPEKFKHDILNDSKQLSEKNRYGLVDEIKSKAIAWGIGVATHEEIDEINILNASYLAMHRALDKLETRPNHVLVDGNRFNAYKEVDHTCIVKGDSKFYSIAAASVLAKTYRDDFMKEASETYPQYSWQTNYGYPTKAHRDAIREFGATPIHRKSFQLLPIQMELFD